MRFFMNMFSTQSKAILCAMAVAFAPVLASEQHNVGNTQNTVVWYKKRSNQVIAGLAAATVGLYVFAVYKDMAASPAALFAAFTGLFGTQKDMLQPKNEDETKKDAQTEQNQADAPQQQDGTDVKPNVDANMSQQVADQKTDDVNPDQANPAADTQNPQNLPQGEVSSDDQSPTDVAGSKEEKQSTPAPQQPENSSNNQIKDPVSTISAKLEDLGKVIEEKKRTFKVNDPLFVNQYL